MSHYFTENPLTDALRAITGVCPPSFVNDAYNSDGLSDKELAMLQDWCSINARPHWTTGESILDAAELIVERAVENANIEPRK